MELSSYFLHCLVLWPGIIRLNQILGPRPSVTPFSIFDRLFQVLSILLYGAAEMWSVSVTNTKKLEVAHHRWQRKILKLSWKDMVTNKVVRERTGQDTLESIIRRHRLRWFGHVYRMDSNRLPRQVLDWTRWTLEEEGDAQECVTDFNSKKDLSCWV